ncbi:MAG: hypothetical protein R6X12_09165 [bacterium]
MLAHDDQGSRVGLARAAGQTFDRTVATGKAIDALVYELYGLTEEDGRIAEGLAEK